MPVEHPAGSRIQVRGRQELLAPAACMVCLTSTPDVRYVDFNTFVDYEGESYVCENCLYEAMNALGLHSPEEVKFLQDQCEGLAEANQKLTETNERLSNDLRNYNYISDRILADFHDGNIAFDDETRLRAVEDRDGSERSDGAVTSNASDGEVKGKSKSSKSVKVGTGSASTSRTESSD